MAIKASIAATSPSGARVDCRADDLIDPGARERAKVEAIQCIKRLRLVSYGDRTMRQRFTYGGESLWWFTELYLHKMRRLDTAMESIAALDACRERHSPSAIEVLTDDATVREAAIAWGTARRVAVRLGGPRPPTPSQGWKSLAVGLTAKLPRFDRAGARPSRKVRVAAFVHTAFWRGGDDDGPQQESYIGPVLDAVEAGVGRDGIAYVGVGPRRNFRARRWWDPLFGSASTRARITPIERLAPRAALAGAVGLWNERHALAREVVSGTSIREAALWNGCDLWPILSRELEDAARVQWPWSARAIDEARAALSALQPDVAVTYAEAGGWGRAMVLAARALGVASVGIQHGFIYRHWLNYLHAPDEIAADGATAGFPAPDRTLVFDTFTAAHLVSNGHLPPDSVRVTGNARLDDLVASVDRERDGAPLSVRQQLGIPGDAPVVLLAAKFSEIGFALPALFRAVSDSASIWLVVKTHPAETAQPYEALAEGLRRITIAPSDIGLARLLAAADGVATMNSTVAIDALVLGVPSIVIGLPNNLTPFVDAGVMVGADESSLRESLERLLYDRQARAGLIQRGRAFAHAHGMRAAGDAAARAAEEILVL